MHKLTDSDTGHRSKICLFAASHTAFNSYSRGRSLARCPEWMKRKESAPQHKAISLISKSSLAGERTTTKYMYIFCKISLAAEEEMRILSIIMRWRPLRIKDGISHCTRIAFTPMRDRGAFYSLNDHHDVQIFARHFDSLLLWLLFIDRERNPLPATLSARAVPSQLRSRRCTAEYRPNACCSRAFKSNTVQVRKYNPIDVVK